MREQSTRGSSPQNTHSLHVPELDHQDSSFILMIIEEVCKQPRRLTLVVLSLCLPIKVFLSQRTRLQDSRVNRPSLSKTGKDATQSDSF